MNSDTATNRVSVENCFNPLSLWLLMQSSSNPQHVGLLRGLNGVPL